MALARPNVADHFDRVSRLIRREAGITISAAKTSLLLSRLNKRIAATGTTDLSSYLDLIESPSGSAEMPHLISALTTNHTLFFRESHHFDKLRDEVLPALLASKRGAPIRIWSAGCSSGQEPYSIAMTIRSASERLGSTTKIIATDIDQAILARAKTAEYSESEIANVPRPMVLNYFHKTAAGYRVRPMIRDMVTFRQMNLNATWPRAEPYDIIFCRNVVIYFDARTQSDLWRKFHRALVPGGWLMIGHSERVTPDVTHLFKPAGITTYHPATPKESTR